MAGDDDSKTSESSAFGVLLKEIAKPAEGRASSPPDLIGAKLHQFRVLSVLGHGGMGVVYRAEDTSLGRHVALKVLPHALSDDPERRRRLLREARSAAAIAHPNIAAVYEVKEADGQVFLVMELVDGETLREKLRDGSLPVSEAVRVARAIARGLATAHEKGIAHRDLKPENVMVSPNGDVKILDFGLAKLLEPTSKEALENQRTETALTEEGMVLGTLAYMSPEQASGGSLDGRTDVYSLGVVLYEMATGKRPFDGEHRSELLAAVLRDEPVAPSRLNPSVSPELERAILKCLRKKSEERFATAGELLKALEGKAALAHRRRHGPRVAVLGGALALAGGAAVVLGAGRSTPVGATAASSSAKAVVAPAPAVTRIIDLPPPPTKVPAAATAFAGGIQAIHDDNWVKALGLFAEATTQDPAMASAYLYLSLTSIVITNPPMRRAAYEKAASLRAQLGERDLALLEAVQPFLQPVQQDIPEADRRLRALAARYPGDVEVWTILGVMHYGTTASGEAAEHALTLDPGDAQSWENRGHGALALGRFAEAHEAFTRCGSLTIDGSDCFLWEGVSDSLEGRCSDFEREARRAADRNPFFMLAVLWALGSTGTGKAALEETEKQAIAAMPPPINQGYFRAGIDVRMAIVDGDFARAAMLAKKEATIVTADESLRGSYEPHYDLTTQLVEISLETGDDAGTRQAVGDFLAHRDAWPIEAVAGHAVDLSLYYARLALPAGQPPPPEFEAQRKKWIDAALVAGADRGEIWNYGYASPALTPSEAEAARAALADWGPPTPTPANFFNFFGRIGSPEADLGRVYLLAGDTRLAIGHLTRAVAGCDVYQSTIDHVRAALNLGRALEQTGDTKGACDAYGKVLAQWGHAKPKSVTADAARDRSKALGCAPRVRQNGQSGASHEGT